VPAGDSRDKCEQQAFHPKISISSCGATTSS
jgi:hypothetical protein